MNWLNGDLDSNINLAKLVIATVAFLTLSFSAAAASHPTANLDITRSGQIYTLDASQSFDSDGQIETYKYDLENDGSIDRVSNSSSFSTSFSTVPNTAKVIVEDNNGLNDTDQAKYPDPSLSKECDIQGGFLRKNPEYITEGETSEIMIPIYNDGDSQLVRVTYYKEENQISQKTKEVPTGTTKFRQKVSPKSTTEYTAIADTLGEPCGDTKIIESPGKVFVNQITQRGSVDFTVEDVEGNKLENARVEIKDKFKTTEQDGRAVFTLKPGEYNYRISRNGYKTVTNQLKIESGTTNEVTVVMAEKSANTSLKVRTLDEDGNSLEDVEIRVKNSITQQKLTNNNGRTIFSLSPGSYDVQAEKNGYEIESRSIQLDAGEEGSITFNMERINDQTQDSTIDLNVKDEFGNPVENARVEVENGDNLVKFTDSFGRAQFDVDADTYDITVTKSGYDSSQRTVTVQDGDFRTVNMVIQSQNGGTGDEADLDVNVYDEDNDELSGAKVRVRNGDTETRFTDNNGRANFQLDADTYDVRVSRSGYTTETRIVDLDEGDSETLNFRLDRSSTDQDARLDVEVEDRDGNELRDARVEVENGERHVRLTDRDGEVRFFLQADTHDVEVSRSGYRTQTRSISLTENDRETMRFRLDHSTQRDHLRITGARLSSSTVCRGDTVYVNVDIRNEDPTEERVTLEARGLGSTVAKNVNIDGDSTEEKSLRINNVQGFGTENLEVIVTNDDTDQRNLNVNVESCDDTQPPSQTASSASINVEPQEVKIGNSVKVSGYVDGTRGSQSVKISVSGNQIANVATEPDGFYSAYINPQQVGVQEIRAEVGDRNAVAQVRVLPNVHVASVSTPDKVFESSSFQVCADVQSQVEPSVVLVRDGERIDSKRGNGKVCFNTQAPTNPGEYDYEAFASGYGVTDTKSREVEVLEEDDEVKNFPGKLAMVRSGDGITRVTLYNTGDDLRTYDVSVSGIPDDWFATTEKQVKLSKGERENVYFYVTPEAEGNFAADIEVDRDGSTVFQDTISISSGGTTVTQEKSWIERISTLFVNY